MPTARSRGSRRCGRGSRNSAAYKISKVKDDGPDEPAGDGHDAKPGEHWLQQSVRWRETFVNGKATDGVAARGGTTLYDPKKAWRSPLDRDPLVPRQVYNGIEGAIKTLKSWF